MIDRFPGLPPTRSRAVVHDDLVFTVAVAPDPVTPSMYEQTRKALARIDEGLALCGTDKSKILSAIVYINGMALKSEMNRPWDEWGDRANPPMRACIGVELEPPHIVEIVVTARRGGRPPLSGCLQRLLISFGEWKQMSHDKAKGKGKAVLAKPRFGYLRHIDQD